jgi:hypothetical protein
MSETILHGLTVDGTLFITGSLVVTGSNNIPGTAISLTGTVPSSYILYSGSITNTTGPYYLLKDGAIIVNTGSTDATGIVQTALNTAVGSKLYVRPGTYNITSLALPSNIIVEGEGSGSLFNITANNNWGFSGSGVYNVKLRNFGIKGPGTAIGPPYGSYQSGNPFLTGVILFGNGYGTNTKCTDCTIDSLSIWGIGQPNSSNVAAGLEEQGTSIELAGRNQRISVKNCWISGSQISGINTVGADTPPTTNGFNITDNTVLACGYGVHLTSCTEDATVSHNICIGNSRGIILEGFSTNTDDQPRFCTIVGNICMSGSYIGSGGHGIQALGGRQNVFIGNVCKDNNQFGFHLGTGASGTVPTVDNTLIGNDVGDNAGGDFLIDANTSNLTLIGNGGKSTTSWSIGSGVTYNAHVANKNFPTAAVTPG